jgi:hypothetical protein
LTSEARVVEGRSRLDLLSARRLRAHEALEKIATVLRL